MIGKNLTSNLFSKACVLALSVLFVPYYIKLIGIEAYGIVGIYTALFTLFGWLDLGLNTTINREMARLEVHAESAVEFRNLTRTLEWIYWITAGVICLAVLLSSSFLANHWIHAEKMHSQQVQQAICWVALALAFQWPGSLYSSGLMGLQRQVLLNWILLAFACLKVICLIYVLTEISATIQAFFIVQTIMNMLQTSVLGLCLWKVLPQSSSRPRFEVAILHRVKKFATGIASISILVVILCQLDKVILSKILSLELFGYYCLATTVANSLNIITASIFSSFFPKFSQCVVQNDGDLLKQTYHKGCQVAAVMLIPIALVVSFFSTEILYIWTGVMATAEQTGVLVRILMIGTLFNGLMTLPYGMQLAYSWTKLGIYQNVVGIIFLIPLLIFGVNRYGAIGAAGVWVLLNAGYLLISIPVMHKKILPTEKWRWYSQDVIIPFLAVLFVVCLGKGIFFVTHPSIPAQIALLFGTFLLATFVAVAATGKVREMVLDFLMKRKAVRSE